MSSSQSDRELVLGRIRAALDSKTAAREDLPLPPVLRAEGLDGLGPDVFAERAVAAGAQVIEVKGEDEAVAAVRALLGELGAGVFTASDASLALRSVRDLPGEFVSQDAERADLFRCDVGVSGVESAIAETGTLVLSTATEKNRLTSLVPETHIALVRRDQVVPTLDHALADQAAAPPRCVTFITGPSRTADIELELVVGVHGPRALHIVLY